MNIISCTGNDITRKKHGVGKNLILCEENASRIVDGMESKPLHSSGIAISLKKSCESPPRKRKARRIMTREMKIRKMGTVKFPESETVFMQVGVKRFFRNKSSLTKGDTLGHFNLLRKKKSLMNEYKVSKFHSLRSKTLMNTCKRGKVHFLKNKILFVRWLQSLENSSLIKKSVTNGNTTKQFNSQRTTSTVSCTGQVISKSTKTQTAPQNQGFTTRSMLPKDPTPQTHNNATEKGPGTDEDFEMRKCVENLNSPTNGPPVTMFDSQETPDWLKKNTWDEIKEPSRENSTDNVCTSNERGNPCFMQGCDYPFDEDKEISSAVTSNHNRKSPSQSRAEDNEELFPYRADNQEDITNNSVDKEEATDRFKKDHSLAGRQVPTDEPNLNSTTHLRPAFPPNQQQQQQQQNNKPNTDLHQPLMMISSHTTELSSTNVQQFHQHASLVNADRTMHELFQTSTHATELATGVVEDWVVHQDRNDNAGHDDLFNASVERRMSRAEQYDLVFFNTSINRVKEMLTEPKFQTIGQEYPIHELAKLLEHLGSGLEEYRKHVLDTHGMLNDLCSVLKKLRVSICTTLAVSPQGKAEEDEDEAKKRSAEELELKAQAAEMAASMAEINGQVAEAYQLTTQCQATAVQHRMSANTAAAEARKLEAELEEKMEMDRRKRREEEERRRQEAERKKLEEETRKAEENRKRRESLWKKEEEALADEKSATELNTEDWPTIVYPEDGIESGDIHCIIKSDPEQFQQSDVTVQVIPQSDIRVTYREQEELISQIIEVRRADETKGHTPDGRCFVALPCLGRLPPSREMVVKEYVDGAWEDILTAEVAFEKCKEYKFAQAEIERFSKFLLMSRFKRDFLMIPRLKRVPFFKVMSSYDHRVAFTLKRGTFDVDKQKLILQVQPVESISVTEFRNSDPQRKRLLATSPVLHTNWEDAVFKEPIRIALPCPPNPATAKKIALAKKMKEEKLQAPKAPVFNPEDLAGKVTKKVPVPAAPRVDHSVESADDGAPKGVQNKWYMGQYGLSEDDENDHLNLMTYALGKWSYASHIPINQSKVDLVTFCLDAPCERLIVLRTLTDVDEESLKQLTAGLIEQLVRRSVHFVVKQNQDDRYDVCFHLSPIWNLERLQKTLKADGYTEGSDKPVYGSIHEGDIYGLKMSGNLQFQDPDKVCSVLHYNSNLNTTTSFHVTEKNKYLQRNFEVFRGALQVSRIHQENPTVSAKPRKAPGAETPAPQPVFICNFYIDIPKDNVEPDPVPIRVGITLPSSGPLSSPLLQILADEMGDEWQDLADKLHLEKVRIQAIVRAADGQEDPAKYEMLLSWFKRCPQAADKVTILATALQAVGRKDLANSLRSKKKSTIQPVWREGPGPSIVRPTQLAAQRHA